MTTTATTQRKANRAATQGPSGESTVVLQGLPPALDQAIDKLTKTRKPAVRKRLHCSLKLTPAEHQQLLALAEATGLKQSHVVDQAVEEYVALDRVLGKLGPTQALALVFRGSTSASVWLPVVVEQGVVQPRSNASSLVEVLVGAPFERNDTKSEHVMLTLGKDTRASLDKIAAALGGDESTSDVVARVLIQYAALRRTVARTLPYQAALSTSEDRVLLGLASLTAPLGVASAQLAEAIGFLVT